MQAIRNGFGYAALLGILLAMTTFASLAEGMRLPRNLAEVIRGHGGATGITRQGLANYIALTRAEARAGVLNQLAKADLDANGNIGAEEIGIYAASLSAKARGRFLGQVDEADLDLDGRISRAEAEGLGLGAALAALDIAQEAGLYAVLAFDADGDAAVSLGELRKGLAQVSEGARGVTQGGSAMAAADDI